MARKKNDTAPATPAPEAPKTTTAPQEGQETPQEQPSAQQGQDNAPQPQEGRESGQEGRGPVPAPEPEQQAPAGERPIPYKGTVAISLAVLHKAVGVGTADMLKAVGTLRQGAEVTVTSRSGPYARLKNGLYISEAFLEVEPTE